MKDSGPDVRVNAGPEGIIVDVALTAPDTGRPTRYALALRRQAANRQRVAAGVRALPMVRPGDCQLCEGWGVVGPGRERCQRCQGSGGA
jgi:hypothetical protein